MKESPNVLEGDNTTSINRKAQKEPAAAKPHRSPSQKMAAARRRERHGAILTKNCAARAVSPRRAAMRSSRQSRSAASRFGCDQRSPVAQKHGVCGGLRSVADAEEDNWRNPSYGTKAPVKKGGEGLGGAVAHLGRGTRGLLAASLLALRRHLE